MNPSSGHNVRENLLLALDTLRGHKFRSFLTILGVMMGVVTVILVASIFAGLETNLAQAIEGFGTRNIFIYKWDPGFHGRLTREERLRKPLTFEDAKALEEQCPDIEMVAAENFVNGWGAPPSVKYKNEEMLNANFLGATPNDFRAINAELRKTAGRRSSESISCASCTAACAAPCTSGSCSMRATSSRAGPATNGFGPVRNSAAACGVVRLASVAARPS